MKQKTESILVDHNSNLWGNCFRIKDEVAENFVEGKDRRVLCTINGMETIHCALMPSPQGFFILINSALKRKLKLSLGDRANLEIEKDESKYGMSVSEEFEAVVIEDEEVAHYFEQLTPGKQRNLIHLVNQVKNPDIRINRAMAIVKHLILEKGEIEFKKLNALIKEFNSNRRIS